MFRKLHVLSVLLVFGLGACGESTPPIEDTPVIPEPVRPPLSPDDQRIVEALTEVASTYFRCSGVKQ